MKSTWRTHLSICLFLGLIAVPVYFLDLAVTKVSHSDWITLDFRGIIFWSYIALLAIDITLSSIALLVFPNLGALRIYLGSIVLSLILLASSVAVLGELNRWVVGNQQRTLMEKRRSRIGVIELKAWRYVPDDIHPAEIRVNVVVHDSGRFAGNVTGEQTDPSSTSKTVFESIDQPERQLHVRSGDAFSYAFPLRILDVAHANNVQITLYLFKAESGPASGDITKVFMNSPRQEDDGQFFYGVLPAPSQPPQ
jgi:hypothetical protein